MNTIEIIKNKKDYLIFEASKWIGIKEETANHSKQIAVFQSVVGRAERESWCLAFVQFCLKEVDEQFSINFDVDYPKHSVYKTEWTRDLWDVTPERNRVQFPDRGDLIVWANYDDDIMIESGHVGIVLETFENGTALVIEGNTKPGPKFATSQDGVYVRLRRLDQKTGPFRVLGYLSPWI